METLELKNRKNTTAKALSSVIKFLNSFDFSDYSDLYYVESSHFDLLFDVTGHDDMHDRAYFSVSRKGSLLINTYPSEAGDSEECIRRWDKASSVFDGTCTYVNFAQLVKAMETLVAKLNKASEDKDAEIQSFLDFSEGWNNYQKTLSEVSEMAKTEETI